MMPVTNDDITNLCADIDRWDDKFTDGDPALLAIEAHALLGRVREMVKESYSRNGRESRPGDRLAPAATMLFGRPAWVIFAGAAQGGVAGGAKGVVRRERVPNSQQFRVRGQRERDEPSAGFIGVLLRVVTTTRACGGPSAIGRHFSLLARTALTKMRCRRLVVGGLAAIGRHRLTTQLRRLLGGDNGRRLLGRSVVVPGLHPPHDRRRFERLSAFRFGGSRSPTRSARSASSSAAGACSGRSW